MPEPNQPLRVAIRTDASARIGTGHLIRCLSLALALRSRGMQVEFLTRCADEQLLQRIRTHDFEIQTLHASVPERSVRGSEYEQWLGVPWQTDADETLTLLEKHPPDWLVVDHYGINAPWERRLRDGCRAMLIIDDLPERRHDCDLLVDQNLHGEETAHGSRVENRGAEILLGPRFALLADSFRKEREARCTTPFVKAAGRTPRMVIFFGGTDPANETAKALTALEMLPVGSFEVDVVAGVLNRNLDELKALCRTAGYQLHLSADMASLYARADLALGAPGVSTWERMCVGIPSLLVAVAENQESVGAALEQAGYVTYLGKSPDITVQDYAGFLQALPHLRGELQRQAKRGSDLVDGRGALRIASRMLYWWLALRVVTLEDSRTIHAWRNSEEVRRCSFDQEPIPLEKHDAWLRSALNDPDRMLLIAEYAGEPLGVVRFDCKGMDATVSIFLNPAQIGSGIGPALLRNARRWLARERPTVRRIFADILHHNYASQTLFREAGYQEWSARYVLPVHE